MSITKTFQITWDDSLGDSWLDVEKLFQSFDPEFDGSESSNFAVKEIHPAFLSLEPNKIYVVRLKDYSHLEELDKIFQCWQDIFDGLNIHFLVLPPEVDIVGGGEVPNVVEILKKYLPKKEY